MDEATDRRLVEILEGDPDFYVPVKKLWLMLQGEGLAQDLELEAFHAQLVGDSRFEFIDDVDQAVRVEDDPELMARMQMAGLFDGPRVKLIARQMTTEDVLDGLRRSLRQLNEALQGAWASRPEGDEASTEMLRDILEMAEQLEREVDDVLDDDESEEDPPAEETG
ncbi:MAG: hypothetical protein PVI59_03010 [Anaerolineae bacterium]|jgi:hypothetical protein